MALKNLFVKDTRIIVSWEERYAKIQLVYNDIIAPYKTIAEHWEQFVSLRKYFTDENASYAIIQPSQFSAAMKTLGELMKLYGSNKRMCFIIDDKTKAIQILNSPPEDYRIIYWLNGSELMRVLPNKAIECEDGWTVWNNNIWYLPQLSEKDLQGFRRHKIAKDEMIPFLKNDLPLYRSTGQEIDCDIDITDEPACTIEFGRFERDAIELIINWSVPLDSIDPSFDIFGYVKSNNTIYSGLNPLEIEQFCPNISGKNGLSFDKIAIFLDNAYEKWLPWFTGDTQKFEGLHHWLKPPFYTFLRVGIKTQNGIGKSFARPYILIGNECLSATIVKQALSSEYFHLIAGWIKTSDLKAAINSRIINDPDIQMTPFYLSGNQILHQGDKSLTENWQDILFAEKHLWYTGGTKASVSSAHLNYLFKQGLDGGLSGGYETFMAYGLPYLVNYLKENQHVKPLLLLSNEYQAAISTIIENTPILKNSDIEVVPFNHLKQFKQNKHTIGIVIEPETTFSEAAVAEHLTSVMGNCDICLVFAKKKPDELTKTENILFQILLRTAFPSDIPYLIRDVRESHDAPQTIKFTKDLHLPSAELIYHEQKLNIV